MEKNYSLLKVMFIGILASVILSTLLIGCSKDDDDDSSSSNSTIFGISFLHNDRYDDQLIGVGFTTTDRSIIPEVEVNGKVLNKFWIDEGFGGWMEIPYSNVLNYKVTANGKTTSGSISMPSQLYNVTCNGLSLSDVETNYIDSSNSYNISWQPPTCDYQRFSFYENNVYISEVLESSISNYTLYANQIDDDYFYFDIDVVNGDKLIAGATPSVSGEYGKGFVLAEADNYYSIRINTGAKSNQPVKKDKVTSEERAKNFVKKFNEVWTNN